MNHPDRDPDGIDGPVGRMDERGIQHVLNGVMARLKGVVPMSPTQFTARCPAHDDQHPSLSVGVGDGGQVLLRCHAGCEIADVVEALGLEIKDLFPGTPWTSMEYVYEDEAAQPLFEIVRYPGKHFAARRRGENGGWVNGLGDTRRVPYHLPEVLAAASVGGRVYVVEGEKDVDTLRALGLVATTNPFGAGKWKPEYSSYLAGAEVIVIPDADDIGRRHADMVCQALVGNVASVHVLELPDAGDGEDASDFVARGWTGEDFERHADAFPVYRPDHDPELEVSSSTGPESNPLEDTGTRSVSLMKVVPIGELMSRPQLDPDWIVEGLLLASGTSLVAAKPKVGKSSFARNLAAAVSQGKEFLDRPVRKGSVLYLSLEDGEGIVSSSFKSLGWSADISFSFEAPPRNATQELFRLVSEARPRLVIVDTLARFQHLRDFKDYGEVSRVMQVFQRLARESLCHVMLLHHAPKTGAGGIDAAIGSVAFPGGVDTVIELTQHGSQRRVGTRQRLGEDLEPTNLTFDKATKQISLGLPVEVAEEGRLRREIVEALPFSGSGKTEAILNGEVAGDTGAKSKVLRTLVKDGLVRHEGKGRKGDPYLYFRTSPS
ncbi:MAG TPA: AAA family ATPase [Thermoanaerobaculia bacterium]|nr:AAA family ATPase [Thermoanaerobaculia bacterium]